MNFTMPNLLPAYPEIFLLVMVSVILVLDLFLPQALRYISYVLTQLTLLGCAVLTLDVAVLTQGQVTYTFTHMFVADLMGHALKVAAYIAVFTTLVYSRSYLSDRGIWKGEFFALLRQEALDGESEGTLYIELSADRGADPLDRSQWRKANPSFPLRTSERAMLRLRKKLKNPDSWNREALGIWDEITKQFSPVNGALWADGVDIGPPDGAKPAALGVDMSHDRQISVGACWIEQDSAHVEEVWAGVDEPGAVDWVVARAGRQMQVVIDTMSPASSMIPVLKARGVKVHPGGPNDMARGCGLIVSDVDAGRLTHADQEPLNDARDGARKRAIEKAGGWGYNRVDPTVYIHPLVAVTLARVGAAMAPRKSNRTGTGRRVITG
jgi:hypothetical protein